MKKLLSLSYWFGSSKKVARFAGSGPFPKLTPDEMSSAMITLCEQNCASRAREISDAQFRQVCWRINQIAGFFRPNGSRNTIAGMASTIAVALRDAGLTQRQWCDEVWRRSGYKNCLTYNLKGSFIAPEESPSPVTA